MTSSTCLVIISQNKISSIDLSLAKPIPISNHFILLVWSVFLLCIFSCKTIKQRIDTLGNELSSEIYLCSNSVSYVKIQDTIPPWLEYILASIVLLT